jgi:hypothetical protein
VSVAGLQDQRYNDLVNNIYKMGMLEAQTAPQPEKKTTEIQNYEYYKSQMKEAGLPYKGISDWDKDVRTTHQKEFETARLGGYTGSFQEWLRDMTALGGGLNINEFAKRKEVTADISAKKYFTDPEGLSKDVDKFVGSEEVQNKLMPYVDDPKKREIETVRTKEGFIKNKIVSSGGKILNERLDGRTFVFLVEWPDKSTSEVRHAN